MPFESLNIPYLCEGEIVQVRETPSQELGLSSIASDLLGGSSVEKRPIVTYACRVRLPDGKHIVCPDVIDSTLFGGIADYMQIRRRATSDASKFKMGEASNMNANVGERVLIAFINGSIHRPVIVASLQHPLQVPRFEEGVSDSTKPQMFLRYLGLSTVVDEDGQLTISHYGAPKIKYTGKMGIGELAGAALDAAAGALSGLGGGYEGYEEGDLPNDEPDSDAVVPQDYKYKTTMEFLKSGMFRLRDSIAQNITIDPDKSTIEITNNGLSSTQSADGGGLLGAALGSLMGGEDAEVIRLDKVEQSIFINSRKLTTIFSGDAREDTTMGDYTKEVRGNEDVSVFGDQSISITGSSTREIMGDLEDSIYGGQTISVIGDVAFDTKGAYDITTVGDITIDTKGGLNISAVMDGTLDFKGSMNVTAVGGFSADVQGGVDITAVTGIAILDSMGAGIKVSSGKVEVGNNITGIFESVLAIEEQIEAIIDAITQMTVPTGTGPSGPPVNAPAFIQAKTQLTVIKQKLSQVKGSM